jgi:hypothetical protein
MYRFLALILLKQFFSLDQMRARNDKVETMLLDSQEKLSVFVAANDGREIKAAQVFTGEPFVAGQPGEVVRLRGRP